jgi:putative Mn2+ efflux pump MntP
MVVGLFICAITLHSIELFLLGQVIGFFQKKFYSRDIPGFILAALITSAFLGFGFLLGNFFTPFLPDFSVWYAATIFLALGIKMFYSGIKLYKAKQLINPLDAKGLIVSAILSGLNAFFIGLSFGLLQLANTFIYLSFLLFLCAIFFGYFEGFNRKKLPSRRFEFVSGVFYMIIAILLVTFF